MTKTMMERERNRELELVMAGAEPPDPGKFYVWFRFCALDAVS
jgi:hypothetical protein